MNQENINSDCCKEETSSSLPSDAVKFEGCCCHGIADAKSIAIINTATKQTTINKEALESLDKPLKLDSLNTQMFFG